MQAGRPGLTWREGCGRWYADGFLIAECYDNQGIKLDAWALSAPQAVRLEGAPFLTLELAKAACESHASREPSESNSP